MLLVKPSIVEIQIKATNINLTDAIGEYINKRLTFLDKLVDPKDTSVLCQVEVEKTTKHHKRGEIFRSEINLHIAGQDFRAEAKREKLYDAIDETKNQMTKELRRYKDKRQSSIKKGGAAIKDILRSSEDL